MLGGRFMLAWRRRFLPILALIAAGACSSMTGVQNAPLHAGVSRAYTGEFNTVLRAAREAITESGLNVESANEVQPGAWMIMAKAPTSWWSAGEIIRVVVDRTGTNPGEVMVRVYSRKRIATNIGAKGDYATTLLSNIDLKLRSQ